MPRSASQSAQQRSWSFRRDGLRTGSDRKLQAYYHDGDDWVTDGAWVGVVDDQDLFAYLHLSGKVGYLRWSDFLDTVGDPYPTAGSYESRVYDAGRSVDWTRISWTEVCPSGTDVEFQVAVSEDADGPWSYGSALTTAAGTTITSTTGRYARFKLTMTGDGSDTPVVNDVQITHDGTSGSRVTRWSYDDAGNITEQARVTDAGTETDTRTYNNLNQLTTSSGGWTYQFDLEGNMVGKNNGTAEDCEKWEFTWNENCRLVQVKKGVYDATPTLVNAFTVDYRYDEMGRMLRRDDGTDVTTYCWDSWDLFRETTGESVTEYTLSGMRCFSFLRDGELHTLHCDGLGNIRAVSDSSGAFLAKMEFDAFGEVLLGSSSLASVGMSMGFVGGLGVRRDPLTGLDFMRERWFNPVTQRFISRDPLGLDTGANLYMYVTNPATEVDPSGLGCLEQVVESVQTASRTVGPIVGGGQISASLYLAFALELGAAPAIGATVFVSSLALTGYIVANQINAPVVPSAFDPLFNVTAQPARSMPNNVPADLLAPFKGSSLREEIQKSPGQWTKRSIQDVPRLIKDRGPRGSFEVFERYTGPNEALNTAAAQGLCPRTLKDTKWIAEIGQQRRKALGKRPRTHRLWIVTQQGTRLWMNENPGVEKKPNEPGRYGIEAGTVPDFNKRVVIIVPQRL